MRESIVSKGIRESKLRFGTYEEVYNQGLTLASTSIWPVISPWSVALECAKLTMQ